MGLPALALFDGRPLILCEVDAPVELMIPSSFMATMYATFLLLCLAAALVLNTLFSNFGGEMLLLARCFILIIIGPGLAENLPRVT